MSIRVLVADDHPLIRSGVIAILCEHRDIEVVGEVGGGDEAILFLRRNQVDVLVLDLMMPDGSGLDVLGRIAAWPKRPKVVVLSHFAEEHLALQAMHAGASGYLPKETAPEQLIRAVRKVHAGGRFVTEALADRMLEVTNPVRSPEPHERLAPREFQVFMALAAGRKMGAVAADFGMSLSTAHTYRRRVHEKMGVETDVELARYAMQRGLVD